jgi:5'-methylthioadenosine phosphorylase
LWESDLQRIAIIGGTGLESLAGDWEITRKEIETPYGNAIVSEARLGDREILFVSRHGESHDVAPHEVNYRANIDAIRQHGVERILATNAVGSLKLDLPPGSLVILDDFIDFTSGRASTFWESGSGAITHTDYSQPYCPQLQRALLEAAAELDLDLLPWATYLCVNGPRFESSAETRMFAQWGGEVVGMTGLPEATLAREAGLCYAAVGIVTNYAAGLTTEPVDHAKVVVKMKVHLEEVGRLLMTAIALAPNANCPICQQRK